MTSLEVFILFSPQIQDANPLSDSEDNKNGKVTLMETLPCFDHYTLNTCIKLSPVNMYNDYSN